MCPQATTASIVKNSVHQEMPSDLMFGEIIHRPNDFNTRYKMILKCSIFAAEEDVDQLIQSKILKSDRSWICADCNHSAVNRTHLYEHIESKHVSSGYNCQYCQKFVRSRNALRSHMHKYHRE